MPRQGDDTPRNDTPRDRTTARQPTRATRSAAGRSTGARTSGDDAASEARTEPRRKRAPKVDRATKLLQTRAAGMLVRVPNAFKGFAPADAFETVLAALKESGKPWKRGQYTGPRLHILDGILRCGTPLPNGRRCNLRLHAIYIGAEEPHGTFRYHVRCNDIRDAAHISNYPSVLEDVVLAIVLEEYAEERIEAYFSQMRLTADDRQAKIEALQRDLARMQREAEAASKLAISVGGAGNEAGALRYATESARLDTEALNTAAEIRELEHEAGALDTVTQERIDQVLALAKNVRALVHSGRAVPREVATILRGLIRQVYVRRIASGICEIDVLFPGGGVVRHVALLRGFRCPQPSRVWAWQCDKAGQLPEQIADELNRDVEPTGNYVAWHAERVRTAVAIQEYFDGRDGIAPRPGADKTIDAIAVMTGMPDHVVRRAALRGELGPACVCDGALVLQPTEKELHAALPDYARRTVAQRMHWPEQDTISLIALSDETGILVETLGQRSTPDAIARDDAGHRFVRRSVVLERGVRRDPAEPQPTLHSDEVRHAVAALRRSDLHADEFMTDFEVLHHIRATFGFGRRGFIRGHVRSGHLVHVYAPGRGADGRHLARVLYVYFPVWVRTTDDRSVLRHWLRGRIDPPGA